MKGIRNQNFKRAKFRQTESCGLIQNRKSFLEIPKFHFILSKIKYFVMFHILFEIESTYYQYSLNNLVIFLWSLCINTSIPIISYFRGTFFVRSMKLKRIFIGKLFSNGS